jgi:hypothetical protein
MDTFRKILARLGILVVDHRFIEAVITIVALVVAVPESSIAPYVQSIGILIMGIVLIFAHTKEPVAKVNAPPLPDLEAFFDKLNEFYSNDIK